jgi:hypothetical protein
MMTLYSTACPIHLQADPSLSVDQFRAMIISVVTPLLQEVMNRNDSSTEDHCKQRT